MRVFGIRIKIDPTFWSLPFLLSFWVAKDSGGWAGLRMFVLVLLVFVCVLGHELSHSVVAQAMGIRVPVITLYPMGGVASMQRIPRDPNQEFFISIVGPVFNFLLAALLFYPLLSVLGRENLFSPSLDTWPRTFANVFWANLILGFFNLIPAFPMDGGRIFRSLLSRFMDYFSATRIAVILGRFFAILFFLLGLWKGHWMLCIVGVYVFFSASRELRVASHDPTTSLKEVVG